MDRVAGVFEVPSGYEFEGSMVGGEGFRLRLIEMVFLTEMHCWKIYNYEMMMVFQQSIIFFASHSL